MYHKLHLLLVLIFIFPSLLCAKKAPFSRGVNITNWFQSDSPEEIQFTKYTKEDFENIKSLGCDVIRLPINLHYMTNGEPDYTISPLFYTFLDEVISWAEELNLHLIIDNHTFSVDDNTDPDVVNVLIKVWPQIAERYKDSYENIYYEILNEPHGIDDNTWNSIQQQTVNAIRKVDTNHTIIVGPTNWNSYNNLSEMPEYDDDNLIYTFHFYDPFLFTHQGASWSGMEDWENVPFPYNATRMPEIPESKLNHWSASSYNNYQNTGTVEAVQQLIDIAVDFAESRNVPIYCGEYGVYRTYSPDSDRVYWYGVVRKYLESKNIAWTTWDYHGNFGLFNINGNDMFKHDLNIPLCDTLGFTSPEQTLYTLAPDSIGFEIYSDYIGENINNSSYADGDISFYSTNQPNSGNYCIEWSGASQYQALAFNFSPDKDLSQLVEEGYAVCALFRSTDTNGSLDFRFLDTDTGDDDHPWRIKKTIDNNVVEWNGQWEKVYIPLTEFTEQGAWENEWFNPEGLFDWSAVDRFEIVTETQSMTEESIFWIDDIFITNQDTASIKDYSSVSQTTINDDFASIQYFSLSKELKITSKSDNKISYQLYNLTGKKIKTGRFENSCIISTSVYQKGIYVIVLNNNHKQVEVNKIQLY